ncbi:VOC family protein [Streptomyces sp. NPDC054834]
MGGEAPLRLGLRVADVTAAAALYRGLAFEQVGSVPGPDGQTVMAILRRGDLQLLVDALTGLPFPESEREQQTKTGPRGLGVVIGLEVDDVDAVAHYCRSAGCQITVDPVDAPWGERYCECVDPYGYCWKFFRLLPEQHSGDLGAAYDWWFGPVGAQNAADEAHRR